jgi:hypothetical protein
MNKFKQAAINVLTSKQAQRFYWTTLNGIVGLGIMAVGELNIASGAVIIAILNGITKEVHNKLKR